jgi:hypothetical protein
MQYQCKGCHAGGCKLWRVVSISHQATELQCITCLSKMIGEDLTRIEFKPGELNWTFGSWIPAVYVTSAELNPERNEYWGYSEDKKEAYGDWMAWYALPNRATKSISKIWLSGRV